MLALLAQRNFLLLWTAHTISILGDYVFFIAITFWIYEQTGSASATGLVLIVSTVPVFLVAPLAGMVVDRWSRRGVMFVAETARAVLFLGLLYTIIIEPSVLWPIYVVAFVQSMLAAFFWPARGALLPQMIEPQAFLASNALYMVSDSIVRIIAPSLSMLTLLHLGPTGIIIIDAVSFILSAGSICLLNPTALRRAEEILPLEGTVLSTRVEESQKPASGINALRELRESMNTKRCIGVLLVLGAVVAYTAGTLSILFPAFARMVLFIGPLSYGWLMTAPALGESTISILLGRTSYMQGRGRAMGFVAGCFLVGGLMLVLIVSTHSLIPAVFLNLVFGAATAGISIQILTWLQRDADEHFSGRVLVIYASVQAAAQVAGMSVAGGMIGWLGVGALMVIGGGLYVGGSALSLLFKKS